MDRDRTSATLAAAEVLLANVMGILSTTTYALPKLNQALTSLGSLDWSPVIIQKLGMAASPGFLPA